MLNPFFRPHSNFSAEQITEIKQKAKDIFDVILDFSEMKDQIDVVGKRGGDICHFRFYSDGTMVEK